MAVEKEICSKCGRPFKKKTPVWHVQIKIWADYEREIDPDQQDERYLDESIQKVLRSIEYLDEKILENQIYQEFNYKICKDCRDRFAANPLNAPLEIPPEF